MKLSPLFPLLLLPASGTGGAVPPTPTPSAQYTVECTFTNPAYSGTCGVSETTPGSIPPEKACRQILECLNNVQCSTKTYCNATTVRGGWRLVTAGRAKRSRS